MEIKYYKDFRHNFLILKDEHASVNQYQCKMITGNEIQGLLPCKERYINGEMLLYYEITSKQNLASLYECRQIGMELLCKLFVQLKMVWNGMSGFLLEEKCLLLKPEFIFVDVETGDFSFLYYPFEPEEDYMRILLEFFTEKVDSDDNKAVDVSYKMLELVEREQFMLDEVLQWFEQDYSPLDETESEMSDRSHKEVTVSEEQPEGYFSYEDNEEYSSKTERQIWLFRMLERLFGKKKTKKKLQTSREMWQENNYDESLLMQTGDADNSQPYGNTIFIPWTENSENKLYGVGKGNKNHIDLNSLPVTVGKLVGSVDIVIKDQSISRRHVKFARESGRICMTDLNSTNGTFKNGMRLDPNTSEILEPGDEIRLGKLKFIYR